MFRLVGGTNIVGEDIVCPTGALQNVPDYEYSTAFGEVPLTLENCVKAPFADMHVYGRSEQFKITGAQLLDESKLEQNNFRAFKYINLSVGEGSFTLSSNIPKSSTDSSAYIMLISGNVQEISSENTTAINGVYKGQSRTFPSINGYVTIAYRNDANSNNNIIFNEYWYMLNKGAEEKPHEPYTGGKPSPSPEYPQEIVSAGENGSVEVEVKGKNLFDADRLSNGNFVEFRGVECYKYVDADKGFAFDFSENNSANQLTFTIKMYRETNLNNASGFRFEYSDGTNESHNIKHDTPKTVVTTKGKILKKITSIHAYNEVCYIDLSVTQLEYGTVPTPYEPYRNPQLLTLSTPNGLPGVPVSKDGNYTDADGQQWVCDEIDLERGKYVQRVVIENISGGWGLKPSSDISGRFLQSRLTNTFKTAVKTAVCNIANFVSWGVPANDIYVFALNTKVIYFSPPKGVEITAEKLNAKLNSLSFPVVVVGELATPIERDLTQEEIAAYSKLTANDGTTLITADNENIPTYVSATYPVIPAYGKMEGNTLRVSKVPLEGFKPIMKDATESTTRSSVFIGYADRPDSIAKVYGVNTLDERTE